MTLKAAISPQVLGLLWITPGPITTFPRPFAQIDYFLDGLLTRYVQQYGQATGKDSSSLKEKKNFFVTESFGSPFFVANLDRQKESSLNRELSELMSLIKPLMRQGKNKILCLGEDCTKQVRHLQDHFEDCQFEEISLTPEKS